MKYLLTVFLQFSSLFMFAQQSLGVFESNTDIGKPKNAGAAQYDASNQTYMLRGSGYNIWFNRDEFNYLYRKVGGDFIVTANFEFTGSGGDMHRKTGWMIRESSDEAAASASAVLHGDGL